MRVAPWVKTFGNLSMQEIMVVTSAYAGPYRPWGRGKGDSEKEGSARNAFLANVSLHVWYRTSISWSFDSCQNKVSSDQYLMTISWAQVLYPSRSHVFLKLSADQFNNFYWIVGSSPIVYLLRGIQFDCCLFQILKNNFLQLHCSQMISGLS